MKFSKLALTATVAIFAFATNAQAEGFYFGMGLVGGVTDTDNTERDPVQTTPISTSSDSGGLSGGASVWAGYDLNPHYRLPLRTEFGSTFRFRHDYNVGFTQVSPGTALYGAKSNVQTTDFMASLLWDIPLGSRFKPYIGGGAGAVFIDSDTDGFTPTLTTASDSRWNGAWQAQAGVTYAYSAKLDIRLDYRYIDMGEVSTGRLASGDRFTSDLTSHDFRIGVQWKL